jgi:hypothetical protein
LSDQLTSLSVVPTADADDASPFYEKPVPVEVAETSAFKKYAWKSRHAVGAREDQDILIGCCWVLPEGRRLFHAFLEVVSDNCDDGHNRNTHVDDDDDILIESTETNCIDFGSRALHHEDVTKSDHCNACNMIMPRAKELNSLVDASKIPKERGVLVEDALDKIISTRKANIASEKPPARGTVVNGCPVGKVRKTCVSSWNF